MSDYNQRNIVIILGAGASVEAGAPLMNNFFDRARLLYTQAEIKKMVGDHFDTVFNAINALQSAHSKADLDLYNLESIFTAFEFASLLQIENSLFNDDLVLSLKRVIAITIENSLEFKKNPNQNYGFLPHKAYRTLVANIKQLQAKGYKVTIISFNYDLALDFAFINEGVNYSYCLSKTEQIQKGTVLYLKLHGSFNWRKCQKCNEILKINLDNFLNKNLAMLLAKDRLYFQLGVGRHNLECSGGCGRQVDDVCFLVPPSWNKQGYYESISHVWKRAAEELKGAAYIHVHGYSLPQTDQFFHNLYALGTMGGNPLHCFNVYNPDSNGATEGRFKALLGTGAKNRFKYVSGSDGCFSRSVSKMLEILN